MPQVNRIVINDKKGVLSETYGEKGEKVYAYHPSGASWPSAIVSPSWKEGGIVVVFGGSFEEFAEDLPELMGRPADHLWIVNKRKSMPLHEIFAYLKVLDKAGATDHSTMIKF